MALTPDDRRRAAEVFTELADTPAEQRQARLREYLDVSETVRREVESLLVSLDSAGNRFDRPALGWVLDASITKRGELQPGERIGPYAIIRKIARGGMGAVYEAQRADREYEGKVAIKTVALGFPDESIERRFRRERQILAALQHPNIAALHDGGTTETGITYLVMEYVEGEPIDVYCASRRLSIRDRLTLLLQVCAALQHAHSRLVVHRDLKPGNVLVTPDGVVKLLDFGIAKLLTHEADEATNLPLTAGHERVLTLEYASPEQVRGTNISTVSDVYSLGTVLYELLAGRRPFDTRGKDHLAIERLIVDAPPPPPSNAVREEMAAQAGARSLPALRRILRGDLDAIALKALRKEPAHRYQSVELVAEDIRRYLSGRPVRARQGAWTYRARKFVRRRAWETAAVLLVIVAAMTGAIATYREGQRADARYREGRRLANALIFDVHDAIADLAGTTAVRALLIKPALEYLDQTARDIGRDPTLDHELALAYQRIGDVQGNPTNANLGDLSGARASYEKGLSIAEGVVAAAPSDPRFRRTVAFLHERLADVTAPTGDVKGAVAHQRQGLAIYTALDSAIGTPEIKHLLAVSRIKLADLLGHPAFANLSDSAGAMAEYREALRLLEANAPHAPDLYVNRRYRALLYERIGRLRDQAGDTSAAGLLARSLALRQELVTERPSSVDARRDVAIAHFLLCGHFLGRQLYDSAITECGKSEEIRTALYQGDRQNSQLLRGMALINRRIGDVLHARGDVDGARTRLVRAVAYYDSLAVRGAATRGDSADLVATRAALRRVLGTSTP